MTAAARVVFLLDVDNTLLDSDRVEEDISNHFEHEFGAAGKKRYWAIFQSLRTELGYADYLGAWQRFRSEEASAAIDGLLSMPSFLLDYPFEDRLYTGALGAIAHLRTRGPTVILSDGDAVFQPRKIQRSGLAEAVEGRVLIYIHKERMLDDLKRRYPARYVMVDDKLSILTSMKKVLGDRLTTVFVRQGHYALDPRNISSYPPADLAIGRIGDLLDYDFPALSDPPKALDTVHAQETI